MDESVVTKVGRVLCANQPIDPTTLWYFCLCSTSAGSLSLSLDSRIALIGRLDWYGVALGVCSFHERCCPQQDEQ
jgi:hypothetical protein